jgi:hypothetical protein
MPRLGIAKLRRLSRHQRNAEGEGHADTPSVSTAAGEPPPSYETAIGGSTQPVGRPEIETSPTITRTVSASYRNTHQPPEYQSSTDLSRPQTVTVASSARPYAANLQNGSSRSLTEALSRAALAGKADAVRALLEAGADIYASSPSGTISAVHDALRGAEPELALLLLDYPCERAYQGELSPTDATLGGDARVKFLLAAEDKDGCTPLHLAASAGAADVVREMLELGAFVDATDKLGRTPLHMAARYGRGDDAMDVLLEHGANAGLVREELWKGTNPNAQIELGDSAFVRRSVAKAVMRRHGVKDGEDFQHEDPYSRKQRASTDHDTKKHGPEQEYGADSITNMNRPSPRQFSSASSASTAGFGASIMPWSTQDSGRLFRRPHKGPTPSPAGFCTTLSNSTGRHARRLPDVTMYSPEYNSWRKMCQTVQEEHRRQKERNAKAGYGPFGWLE